MHPRASTAIAGLLALCGCASTPQLPPIRDGSAVAIDVGKSAPAMGSTQIENRAFICVPGGALVGAFTGTVAGAGIGLTGALSNDKAAQLRERLQRSAQANPPVDALRRDIAERARQHWRVTAGDASVTLTIELQDLLLTSSRDEQIGFVARVRVSARQGGADGPVSQKLYEYVGPTSGLAVWLDERNDFVDTSIRLAMQQLAAQIVFELARA